MPPSLLHPPHLPRRRRGATLFVLLAALLCGIVSSAHAQVGIPPSLAPPGEPGRNSWALTPTGTNPNEPGSRPNLSYEVPPGQVVDDSVTVWNSSDHQMSFRVYATDAFTTPTGGFDLLTGAQKPTDVGAWVTIDNPAFTLPPNSKTDLKLRLSVPADAAPGDHAAGVVASVTSGATDDGGNQVTVDRRVGTRMYVRVQGPISPLLTVDAVNVAYRGTANPLGTGSLDVSYTVRNTGNIRLSARQRISMSGLFGVGAESRAPADIPELLPGAVVSFTETFDGVRPWVRLSGDVSIEPYSATAKLDPPPEATTRSASTWAIPWTLVVLLALLFGGWRFLRRRRIAADEPGATDRATVPVPDDGDGDGDGDDDGGEDGDDAGISEDTRSRPIRRRRPTVPAGMAVLALAAAVGVLLGLGVTTAPEAVAQATPTLSASPAGMRQGDPLTVRLSAFQPGTVTVAVCGNGARNGSADCDLTGAQGVSVGVSSLAHVSLMATPPIGCPCVVRAWGSAGTVPVTTPIEVADLTVPPAPTAVVPATSVVGRAEDVAVETRLTDAGNGGPAFGLSEQRALVLTVRNTGTSTIDGLTSTLAVGRDAESGRPVKAPALTPLAAGEERTYAIPVTLDAPVAGTYTVFGRIHGLDRPVPFAVTSSTHPFGVYLVAGLGALGLVAIRWRRFLRNRTSSSPADVTTDGSRRSEAGRSESDPDDSGLLDFLSEPASAQPTPHLIGAPS